MHYAAVTGHFSDVEFAQESMGIKWLGQKELAQAIPPAYTRYLAEAMMGHNGLVGKVLNDEAAAIEASLSYDDAMAYSDLAYEDGKAACAAVLRLNASEWVHKEK